MSKVAVVILSLAIGSAALAEKERADIIFHNGTILTMDPSRPIARALAIKDGRILAVGSQGEINRLGGPSTSRVNLERRTLMPGIIDPHSHAINFFDQVAQFEAMQQRVIETGVTSLGDPYLVGDRMDIFFQVASDPGFRVRMGVYLAYNSKCVGLEPPDWIKAYPPNHDPSQMFRVLGIKLFGDDGKPIEPFCGWAATLASIPQIWRDITGASEHGELALTAEEMAEVIEEYQALGYQAVIHARGDVVVDAALDAIEMALDGRENVYRHRIDHNDLIRPDQLERYGEVGALPILRVAPNFLGANTCFVEFLGGVHPFGPLAEPWSRVVRSVIAKNPGLPVAWHSDVVPGFNSERRNPMADLWQLVTRKELGLDGHVCEPPEWLVADAPSVEQALRMMTIDAAYMLFLEEVAGSLEPAKFADMIVLSDNPLAVEPDALKDIRVLMTMIGGKVEYCAAGSELICPTPPKPGRPRRSSGR